MNKEILSISALRLEEWISSDMGERTVLKENTLEVNQGLLEIYVIAYRDAKAVLKNIQENTGAYNTYEMYTDIESIGGVEVEVGLSKYYANGQSETLFYKPKQTISFLSEGIVSLYLTIRIRGNGKVVFNKISIAVATKIYLNDKVGKMKKLEKFGEWYKQQVEEEDEFTKNLPIKIATILDEFSYECFKYEAECKQLTYSHWREELSGFKPDLLLVESAWQGQNGVWANRIARFGAFYDPELKELVDYCKENQIPTVFWDKEGLQNFHYFMSTASLFDYVGVTDENVQEIHQAMHPQNHVFILPFAAQPKLHNSRDRMAHPLGDIAFAGSWYGDKYPRRIQEMEEIVKPALLFDLDIYDRNYDKQSTLDDEIWKWPHEYERAIVGKLPYNMMSVAYKQYKVFLNVQSLNDSEWMIPRRIYELLACGVTVISSYSKGIAHQFPDEVYISTSEDETIELLNKILSGEEDVSGRAERGKAKIWGQHTYKHRLEKILQIING